MSRSCSIVTTGIKRTSASSRTLAEVVPLLPLVLKEPVPIPEPIAEVVPPTSLLFIAEGFPLLPLTEVVGASEVVVGANVVVVVGANVVVVVGASEVVVGARRSSCWC